MQFIPVIKLNFQQPLTLVLGVIWSFRNYPNMPI